MADLDRDQINAHFRRLDTILKHRPLPTPTGGSRLVGADEFMLMEADDRRVAFKSIATRNYVYLTFDPRAMAWKLNVPMDPTHPWHRGEF